MPLDYIPTTTDGYGAYFTDPLSGPVVSSGVKLPHGAKVVPGVLDVVFMDSQGEYLSPSRVTYYVAAVSASGTEQMIGIPDRRPLEVRIGRFSPNMFIGDKWFTGTYHLNWNYQINATDPVSSRKIEFEVVSSGIYDVRLVGLGLFNVKATVIVVD